jgi:uncharacterized protein YbaP (TraB family)
MRKNLIAVLLLLLPGLAWGQTPMAVRPPALPSVPSESAAAEAEPNPAIWLLSDADTRIYLFGTIHALSRGLRWRSAAFNRIVFEADELVLEVSDRELRERGPDPLVLMRMGKAVPLVQRVSPDRREGLAKMLRELRIPANALDTFETWGVAALLGFPQVGRNLGHATTPDPTAGVEYALIEDFQMTGRPISGAEAPAEMLATLRRLPLHAQREMLDEVVDAYRSGARSGDPDERRWARGDLDGFAAVNASLPPLLRDLVVTRRNRGFAEWLVRRMDRPGTVLFAIGAGHLTGPDSVQSMLESRGLHVQRIH